MSFPTPYYAVIFTSIRTEGDNGYAEMSDKLEAMVKGWPGFLGLDHARNEKGITICYWDSLESIASWKKDAIHLEAQKLGYEKWYQFYNVKICKVEKEYEFQK